jgi:hydroxyacylglutathione hydrolase
MAAIIPIPAFTDNYIWLLREGPHAVVVDPGDPVAVQEFLERERLLLAAILVTHHHGDHVAGIADLLADRSVPVLGPARERIPGRTQALSGGDIARVPELGLELAVLDVPGHTAGHVAFAGTVAGVSVAFVGDTLFAGGCGRLFEGTPAEMAASLERLAALPPATRVYCAHEYTLANLRFAAAVEPGNADVLETLESVRVLRGRDVITLPTTLGRERRINPFLRCEVPAVHAAAEAHAGSPLPGPAEVFAVLRAWKDGFR